MHPLGKWQPQSVHNFLPVISDTAECCWSCRGSTCAKTVIVATFISQRLHRGMGQDKHVHVHALSLSNEPTLRLVCTGLLCVFSHCFLGTVVWSSKLLSVHRYGKLLQAAQVQKQNTRFKSCWFKMMCHQPVMTQGCTQSQTSCTLWAWDTSGYAVSGHAESCQPQRSMPWSEYCLF